MNSFPVEYKPVIWLKYLTQEHLEFARELRNTNKEYFFTQEEITPDQMVDFYGGYKGDSTYHKFCIIMKDNTPIGTISYKLPGTSDDAAIIGNVLITQSERGNGYGAQAVRLALNSIAALGRQYTRLEVMPGNKHAIEFYKKLGFYEKSLILERNDR